MNPTSKTTPKDFFLHLGVIIVLYTSVFSLLDLFFSVINYYYPDALAGYYYSNQVAWPISMLVVLIPVLYILQWVIVKGEVKDPTRKEIWINRWGIYLTLFLTGATIIGTFISVIYTYLNGELTARFGFKILTSIVVSAVIFKYYFFSINSSFKLANIARKSSAVSGIVLVLVAVVLGFITVGTPGKQRNIRFDNQRTNDLSTIQWQVVQSWQQKGKLPASLKELNDPLSYSSIPTDPENKTDYIYNVKNDGVNGNPSFELCAKFALKTQDTAGRGDYYGNSYPSMKYADVGYYGGENGNNWTHDAGRVCFERIIDKDKYPVNKPVVR